MKRKVEDDKFNVEYARYEVSVKMSIGSSKENKQAGNRDLKVISTGSHLTFQERMRPEGV